MTARCTACTPKAWLALYEIPYEWDARRRRILVGSFNLVRPILRENRDWFRVLEFAEEFGISVSLQPFTLLERRCE